MCTTRACPSPKMTWIAIRGHDIQVFGTPRLGKYALVAVVMGLIGREGGFPGHDLPGPCIWCHKRTAGCYRLDG
jgi:hypothetical protein